jgi:hypothetical protein
MIRESNINTLHVVNFEVCPMACWLEIIDMLRSLIATTFFALPSMEAAVPQRFIPLRFSHDGTFQISIFEDLHFGESQS